MRRRISGVRLRRSRDGGVGIGLRLKRVFHGATQAHFAGTAAVQRGAAFFASGISRFARRIHLICLSPLHFILREKRSEVAELISYTVTARARHSVRAAGPDKSTQTARTE